MGDFLHRASGILRGKLDVLGIDFETWDIQTTQLRFDWGGHVARLKIDPNRLTSRVFPKSRTRTTVGNVTIVIFTFGDGNTTCTSSSDCSGSILLSTETYGTNNYKAKFKAAKGNYAPRVKSRAKWRAAITGFIGARGLGDLPHRHRPRAPASSLHRCSRYCVSSLSEFKLFSVFRVVGELFCETWSCLDFCAWRRGYTRVQVYSLGRPRPRDCWQLSDL